jgi:hypothetical protein
MQDPQGIPGVTGGIDSGFLTTMFTLEQEEVGVAMDRSKSHAYVIRLAEDATTPEERIASFMRFSGGNASFALSNLVGEPAATPYFEWFRDLESEMQLKWLSADPFEQQE